MANDRLKRGQEVSRLFESLSARNSVDGDRIPCHEIGAPYLTEAEEEKIDSWRILLVDLVRYFTLSIVSDRHLKADQPRDTIILRFIETLRQLDQMPDHERIVMIRSKESAPNGNQPAKTEYTVFFGNILLDRRCVEAMVKRLGIKSSYLSNRLADAFEMLSRYKIQSLYIEIPLESPGEIKRMQTSLGILAAYHQALTTKGTVYFIKNSIKTPLTVIYDENSRPCPNLTMLSGLNDVPPETLNAFVNKVDAWMRRPESQALRKQFSSIYSALFGIRKLKEKLKRPPFEINNAQWSMLERVHDVISSEKAKLVHLVQEKLSGTPEEGTKMMECVYGNDFDKISPVLLVDRLSLAAKILDKIEHDNQYATITEEILTHIKKRLEYVPDDTFSAIEFAGNEISFTDSGGGRFRGTLPRGLNHIVHFYKSRSCTKQKIKNLVKGPVIFEDTDYQNIAEEFEVSPADAAELVRLLAACFDETSRQFLRAAFERQIPEFARYEKNVFGFLWYYLSEILSRKERIAFLNAIQHLIDRLEQPQKAVLALLFETCRNPMVVKYADRNAFMLCTLLVRTYNRELHIDTEITPEEVLQVKEGLNPEAIHGASQWIESEQKLFLKKIRTIHRILKETLDEQLSDSTPMPIYFLLTLEREVYIFLSLVGGEIAYSIIRSAVRELGDPEAPIYTYKESSAVLPNLLQLLQTAIRALARAGDAEDIALLRQIQSREMRFIELKKDDRRYSELVRRVIRQADAAIREINSTPAQTD